MNLRVGYFLIAENKVNLGAKVWFSFSVTNDGDAGIAYSGLGAFVPGVLHKPSWGGQVLKPGETLVWEDWFATSKAGLYPVHLGICTEPGAHEDAEKLTASWQTLAGPIMVAVGMDFPAPASAALDNGSFEGGLTGWSVYHISAESAAGIEDRAKGATLVLDGQRALRFEQHHKVLHSGAFQQVRVGRGSTLKLTGAAYLLYGSSVPANNRIREISSAFRVGIDPAGGVDPAGSGVKWGSVGGDTAWVSASVQDSAEADVVTVFADARIGLDWPPDIALATLDSLELEVTPIAAPPQDPDPEPEPEPVVTDVWEVDLLVGGTLPLRGIIRRVVAKAK